MERRSFLKLLAGTAVATQIPSVLLAAEEKSGDYCVRYVRAYDIASDRMVERIDVARGVFLPIHKSLADAQVIKNVSRAYIRRAIETMKRANVPIAAIYALEANLPLKPGNIICVDFSR